MKTKLFARFLSRSAHLDADIELADVLKIAIGGGALHTAGNPHLFDCVNPAQHPRLAARSNSMNSRKNAANHLKATLCSSFLKDIYEDMTQYLQDVLAAAARNGLDPNRLIGEHKVTFEANDVLSAGGWPRVVEMVSVSVFRRLEGERSTKTLLQKINTKLDLGVTATKINAALPYLELRHLLVHADGKADQAFCTAFPAFGATAGQKVALDYRLLHRARLAIVALVTEFDQKVVAKNLVHAGELQP